MTKLLEKFLTLQYVRSGGSLHACCAFLSVVISVYLGTSSALDEMSNVPLRQSQISCKTVVPGVHVVGFIIIMTRAEARDYQCRLRWPRRLKKSRCTYGKCECT